MIDRLLAASPLARRAFRPGLAGVGLFVLSVVLSAGLLFALEPMFTRLVLPRFGGSASVWSVALVFFQGTLLAGYAYAHGLIRFLPGWGALSVHCAVLGAGALFLPPAPAAWVAGEAEIPTLILLFAASIGLPFAALSANAPLLQACFARSGLPGAENPYPLYAASNAGSLGVLIAYPALIEPFATLRQQTWGWALAYAVLLALILATTVFMWRAPRQRSRAPVMGQSGAIDRARLLRWAFWGLVPSAGLVAVTAHLSTDIAAAPFLWIVPLALYLLTFIVAFSGTSAGWLAPLGLGLAPALAAMATMLGFELRISPAVDAVLHLALFFALALYCHGRLAVDRPEAEALTAFYFALSLGGVVGGVLAAIAAPLLFSFVAEYPLVLALGALALPRLGVALSLTLLAVMAAGQLFPLHGGKRETLRSFYGVHTIETTADGRYRTLRHGIEVHGAQQLVGEDGKVLRGRPAPLTYYWDDSPIADAIEAARGAAGGGALRIGVVGLGAGSIACLKEPSDAMHFYEIDPVVVTIARDPARFRFLSACAPRAEIVLGDARQTLAARRATYDILILDAFSSDSIPVHLLTREALATFMERLTPQGVLVLHISNNHLRLQEVVAATAGSLGLSVLLHDEDEAGDAPAMAIQPTVAAIARKADHLGGLVSDDSWIKPSGRLPRAWTDDYASPLAAFIAKLRER